MSRILIIDPEETNREMLSVYSEMLGHSVVAVETASGCVADKSEHCCPGDATCADILLVSQKMTGTTGLDFIQQRLGKKCKVPVQHIAIMAPHLSGAEFYRAKRMGCHCLKKPITYEILENWLNNIGNRISNNQ